jgi:hypothetical protein
MISKNVMNSHRLFFSFTLQTLSSDFSPFIFIFPARDDAGPAPLSLSFQMDISFFSFYFRLTQESFVRDVVCCWSEIIIDVLARLGRKEGRKEAKMARAQRRPFRLGGRKGSPLFYFILDVTNFFSVLILYSLARPCVSFFLFLLLLPHYVETHQKAEHIKC